ncbi:MAG: hypothetical protein M5U28_22000 [Sandaracinaceae bacterium]|nr:hypothetical protein [Sandaracinaceae bacterium]
MLLVTLGLALPAAAQGPSPEQALSEVREMALYARYREALQAAQAFLERTDLDAAQRNTGLEVLATMHIALRDQASAGRVLQQLYARDPEHRLSDPDASPPVLSAFGRARSNPPPPIEVELTHEPPSLDERRPPILEVRLGANADAVQEVRLRYRQADDAELTTLVMNVAEGVARARLPVLERTEAYEVRYFVEALAPSGATIATRGSEGRAALVHHARGPRERLRRGRRRRRRRAGGRRRRRPLVAVDDHRPRGRGGRRGRHLLRRAGGHRAGQREPRHHPAPARALLRGCQEIAKEGRNSRKAS